MARQAGLVVGMLFLAHAAAAQFTQQGSKLVGTGAVRAANQGVSVAISGDGNTAIVGGANDNAVNGGAGAAWVFTRSGGVWSQQGSKLVGTDAVGAAEQGYSVAISGDGNTAIVGGWGDNLYTGAAWVYTRTGGVWTQQGSKLVGSGATVGYVYQGISVALSADGNTAMVGGPLDNSSLGATWVYTRSAGVWTQQGSKLVGTGAVGAAYQGLSVALSADGNTAIVSGANDNSYAGAAWVYTRSNGVWTQQGSKLVGSGATGGPVYQGSSVAISADGNTAIVGGDGDNSGAGATWVYTRSGGVWTQQGSKLVGTGAVGAASQGGRVATSADGNIAIIGGEGDNSLAGAAWVFTRSGGVWTQWGTKMIGTGAVGNAWQGSSVAISADGNTAIFGGLGDNSYAGGAWVFVATACAAPSLAIEPQSQSIQSGQTATLSVTATGATPLSYQWYQGSSSDTSTPVGGNTSSFTTSALTATTSYWVRVSNSCGHADSATAIVSITCTAPSITAQPQSQTIASGQSATLSVTATGTTPLYYQWYQGGSGDTSQPAGTNASSFTSPALTATTNYWVRVFNACGQADSVTATVSINTCAPPSITVQPQSQSITSGQTATLSVTATGTAPLYYQWYEGVSGDTRQPVGSNASSFTTPALTATTSCWVRVFNACGHADSVTATITVGVVRSVRRYLHRQGP